VPSPYSGFVGNATQDSILAQNSCNAPPPDDVTSLAYNWSSSNPSVATVTYNSVNQVARTSLVSAGTATGSAQVQLPWGNRTKTCPNTVKTVNQSISASCAVPNNFQQESGYADSSGILHFTYTWSSSSGNLPDLASSGCTVNENVSYPGGDPYYWKSPPYQAGSSTPNPTIAPVPPVPGANGSANDTHSHPPFQGPYQADSFTATQYYQYCCTCNNSSNVPLAGPISIARSVSQNADGTWKYTITKSGVVGHISPLP
jgi:hypothetical protein